MMTLRRLQRWPDRLAAFVDSRRALPFAWGSNDCCSFAIDAVEAITGRRVWDVTWTDEAGARAVIEEAGGLIAAVSSALGRPGQNWREARRGDVVLAEQPEPYGDMGRDGLMICVGTDLAGPSAAGLGFTLCRKAKLVWRVG